FARVVAEDAGKGVVAVEHPAVERRAKYARDIALEKQPIALLRGPQCLFRVHTLGDVAEVADDSPHAWLVQQIDRGQLEPTPRAGRPNPSYGRPALARASRSRRGDGASPAPRPAIARGSCLCSS